MKSTTYFPDEQNGPKTRYIPVTEWNLHHSWPPIGGLRHLIFYSSTNGFEKAFRRVGRRVLVDESQFLHCVAQQRGGIDAESAVSEGARHDRQK